MSLNNIKKMRSQGGFTIVELLIVIVVIAILAAITIIAYTGINNRAKMSNAQTAANQVGKKAGAFNAIKNAYPANAADFATVGESKLEGVTAVDAASGVTSANGEKTVHYEPCGTSPNFTGARVHFFNYTANPQGLTTATTGDPRSFTVGNCS